MASNPIIIRPVLQEEIPILCEIAVKTFYETFAESNTHENIQKYLEESFKREKIVKEFKTEGSRFYFACYGDIIAAYLKVNNGDAQTEGFEGEGFEIERLYVLKEFKDIGIGTSLMAFSTTLAKSQSADYLWLGVWEHNKPAIKFYSKMGFEEFDNHIFMVGEDRQTDILLKLPSNKFFKIFNSTDR